MKLRIHELPKGVCLKWKPAPIAPIFTHFVSMSFVWFGGVTAFGYRDVNKRDTTRGLKSKYLLTLMPFYAWPPPWEYTWAHLLKDERCGVALAWSLEEFAIQYYFHYK